MVPGTCEMIGFTKIGIMYSQHLTSWIRGGNPIFHMFQAPFSARRKYSMPYPGAGDTPSDSRQSVARGIAFLAWVIPVA